MRLRFTAYAQRNAEYLLASWDANKWPASIDFSKESAYWQKLQISNIKKGNVQDGVVKAAGKAGLTGRDQGEKFKRCCGC
ncbi:MAG: YchJ family metal-binding protein [Methylomonas sp.]|jgi:uncharacterized protein YchJ